MKKDKFKRDSSILHQKISEFSNTRKIILNNLDITPNWVEELPQNPIPYIVKNGNPGEVFLLLRNVYKLTYTHVLYRLV